MLMRHQLRFYTNRFDEIQVEFLQAGLVEGNPLLDDQFAFTPFGNRNSVRVRPGLDLNEGA